MTPSLMDTSGRGIRPKWGARQCGKPGTHAHRRHGSLGEGLEQLAAQAPAGRPAKAEEIGEAIVFLATDRASFIQGAKLAVDGGKSAV
jgi:NAD(P)-dependent dehydrogenase (short-subunit alcohol dehydrogenase family)